MVNAVTIAKKTAVLLKVDLICVRGGDVETFRGSPESSPLMRDQSLRESLAAQAEKQEFPYIFQDESEIYFAGIRGDGVVWLLGPLCLKSLSRTELHSFYRKYGIEAAAEKQLRQVTVSELTEMVSLFADILTGKEYSEYRLIQENNLGKTSREQEQQEQIRFRLRQEEEEKLHHTYLEEQAIIQAVREGRVQDALSLEKNMDIELGRLSANETNHWRNAAIVAITLNTRAAIEGGISAPAAYQLSDYYIQKVDGCRDIAKIIALRNHAVEELTRRVEEHKKRTSQSNYVSRCMDYVNLHYREKIYLNDVAELLGLSTSYLSRLFKKESGMTLQDYICKVRVERAANLLKYSDESIARIAEYVNFPSQSYFGRVFLEQMQMTPKQYRDVNKMLEF